MVNNLFIFILNCKILRMLGKKLSVVKGLTFTYIICLLVFRNFCPHPRHWIA